jgi:spore maturation protein CgeB
MKKILIAGPQFFGYSKSVAGAFKHAGYQVTIMEWVEGGIENLREKFEFNLTANKQNFFDKKELAFNNKLIKQYNQLKPDIVFVIRGSVINRATLKHMQGSVIILWMMDSVFLVEKTFKNIDLYNHIFLFEREDISALKTQCNINAHFLPLALDESVYYPVENRYKPIDILFVGALYDDRIRLLRKITEKFADKNIKIYGVYFSKLRNLNRFLFRKDKKSFTNKILQPTELNIKYSEAKICINMHHSQSVYGVNQRFFELSGAKALQVCDRRGFIEDNFTNDQVLLYSSEEQLFELIEKVLSFYESYEGMKTAVYNEVINNHTFFCRIKKVLKVCQIES